VDRGSDPQAALRRRLDLVEREAVDVDEVCRRFDLELYQVEQIRNRWRSGTSHRL